MSVPVGLPWKQYTGNGSTVEFSFPYRWYSDSDVVVLLTDAAGVITTQTLGAAADYTLAGKSVDPSDGLTGLVTMLTPPAGGGTPELLTIYDETAIWQDTKFGNIKSFQSLPAEIQMDLIVKMVMRLELFRQRTSTFNITNTDTPPSLEALMLLSLGLLSALPGISTLEGADLLHVGDDSDGGADKKITITNLITHLNANLTFLKNVVEDVTPELGANLDTNAFNILFDTLNGILDSSGNEQLIFALVASAVNYFKMTNAATGNDPTLESTGSDTDVGLEVVTKGAGTFNLNQTATVALVNIGNSGASKTIDWRDGNTQVITLTADCTLTFTAPTDSAKLTLIVKQDSTGSWNITWPGTVTWQGGSAPTITTTATTGRDIIVFVWDGTQYDGAAIQDFS